MLKSVSKLIILFFLLLVPSLSQAIGRDFEYRSDIGRQYSIVQHLIVSPDSSITVIFENNFGVSKLVKNVRHHLIEEKLVDIDKYKAYFDWVMLDNKPRKVITLDRYDTRYYVFSVNELHPGMHNIKWKFSAFNYISYDKDYDSFSWVLDGKSLEKKDAREMKFMVSLPSSERAKSYEITYVDDEGYIRILDPKYYTVSSDTDKCLIFNFDTNYIKGKNCNIVVRWRKGLVVEKIIAETSIVGEKADLWIAWWTFIFLLVYYAYIWNRVDGAVVNEVNASSEKVEGFSPASLLYILDERYSQNILAYTILSLAQKGYLRVIERNGIISLERLGYEDNLLSFAERAMSRVLFGQKDRVDYTSEDKHVLYQASLALKDNINKDIDLAYFKFSSLYFKVGAIVSFLSIAVVYLIPFQEVRVSLAYPVFMALINVIAFYILKNPILQGDRFRAIINGFKLFLKGHPCTVRTDSDEVINFKENMSKDMFEEYIIYACALSADNSWVSFFLKSEDSKKYKPDWYDGLAFEKFNIESYRQVIKSLTSYRDIPGRTH